MNAYIDTILKEADNLHGCLAHLKTTDYRRYREDEEDKLTLGNPYVSDEAKLLSSKAYRVLDAKTQVFTLPSNPLIRTRGAHVREVQAISVVTADMLGLNVDLVRAAAIGHDIGHIPFGHQGEEWLAKKINRPFRHEIMGPIIAQKIERAGKGLNLCYKTLEAMMRHSSETTSTTMTPEAWLIRHTDKFAYIFHDINDIERAQYPLPSELMDFACEFGSNQRERVTTAIAALVIESSELNRVSFEKSDLAKKFRRMREILYSIYIRVTQQNVEDVLDTTLEYLGRLGMGDPFLLITLMTDADVLKIYHSPKLRDVTLLNGMAIKEIIPHLDRIGKVDLCDPCLDW